MRREADERATDGFNQEVSSQGRANDQEDERTDTLQMDRVASDNILVTDGGEEIRTHRNINSQRMVREYAADGSLYAYRDGDEHVVVAKGREPATKWTKRVPAERTAVVTGERLWTIPENWECRLVISESDSDDYGIYRIPEPDVHVLLYIPTRDPITDGWYSVEAVGDVVVDCADEPISKALSSFLKGLETGDLVEREVLDALRTIERFWDTFERRYRKEVNRYAMDAFWDEFEGCRIGNWSVDPWAEPVLTSHFLKEFCGVDGRIASETGTLLDESDVIPAYPKVKVSVEDQRGLPEGFHMRALIEAGCSPVEAVDFMMVEILAESPSLWGATRGEDTSTIKKNINNVQQTITE
ncbi:hypothetical protein ACLI4Q_05580 [Natrialbaceae archaeon A-CW1-1]